jgi:uncharacterized protein YfaS (alpha-2-macroglobulin family)
VYLDAFLLGTQENNPLPIFKRALLWVPVESQQQEITVQVIPKRNTARPGDSVQVEIRAVDSLGKPIPQAYGTLGVVDESVLALAGNPKKQPFQFFYRLQRYLGTDIAYSLYDLIDKIEVKFA